MASDLTWRTREIIQGHTRRWRVEVLGPDWKSPEGWSQLTTPPGEDGARRSVLLSLLVDHGLFCHPDHHAQLQHNLPAYTVGSLRTPVPVECLVHVITNWLSSPDPQGQRHHFTHALHEMFVFGQSQKPYAPAPVGETGTDALLEGPRG